MQFNPDSKKQGNEVLFSWKSNTCTCHPVTYNNTIIAICPYQKHLGVVLDSELDFSIHTEQKIRQSSKIIRHIRRLSACLPRKAALFIKLSSDLTSITVIFCMTKQAI